MVTFALCTAFGLFLCWQFSKAYFLAKKKHKELVEEGKLCYLDICDIQIEIWKQLIYHKNKWISKSMKTVIDYIKDREFSSQDPRS